MKAPPKKKNNNNNNSPFSVTPTSLNDPGKLTNLYMAYTGTNNMEDMATPQPTTLDQFGKMYSSYFRPDDVKVLAITTNCNEEMKRRKMLKETHVK